MKCNAMHHFFPLLQLAIWTLYELRLRPHCIIISRPRKRPPEFRYLPRSLIDCNHIATLNLILTQCFDHLRPKIIHRLHLRRLQSQLPGFRCRSGHRWTVDLDFNNFPFDHFGLLFDPYTNSLPKTCISASVLDISSEKSSLPASMANGVSSPIDLAMPMAMAVLPVPGCPARRTARPAILPSFTI
ncbi:hypothetical protein HanRHA438_Chr12g0533921 [Helianthus annuus]|nr:hypothetical protein HanHA300_Chr12g0428291 [Helianthus annuus]KAJ0864814.1 hypothetical protein HanRHA438_Chr12g0533921 [Helianthus annuus]